MTSIGAANFEFAMIAVNAGSLLCFAVMRGNDVRLSSARLRGL
jgi:hypothetical protein